MTTQQIVCPFCHTRQPNAWDCATCARPLHERPSQSGLTVPSLPELESTALDGGEANVAVASLQELESTSLGEEGGPAAGTDALAGLEPTHVEPVGAVPPLAEPGLVIEPTPAAPIGAPTQRSGQSACRYCGTPKREGASRFCVRCGMRVD